MRDGLIAQAADGQLRPVEPTTYPLAEAGALADLAERRAAGRLALLP